MQQITKSERNIFVWVLAFGALGIALLLLFYFDPRRHGFYPRCFFHSLTGLNCPGCGGLRAVHQLLHGNFATALQFNALAVICLPFLGLALLNQASDAIWKKKLFRFHLPGAWIMALFFVMVAFTIARNLPIFAWLSP